MSYNPSELLLNSFMFPIKIIDSMPSEESAMKIIYLRAAEINDKWSMRSLKGYYKCIDEIKEMFQDRYPS